jgi:hypothetical protein
MTRLAIQYTLAVAAFLLIISSSHAQKDDYIPKNKVATEKKVTKPYRILTSGKRITVQSRNNIKRILVWTSSGHRIVEQHELDVPSYNFTIPGEEKIFFLMLETNNGNRYTDKFGVQ